MTLFILLLTEAPCGQGLDPHLRSSHSFSPLASSLLLMHPRPACAWGLRLLLSVFPKLFCPSQSDALCPRFFKGLAHMSSSLRGSWSPPPFILSLSVLLSHFVTTPITSQYTATYLFDLLSISTHQNASSVSTWTFVCLLHFYISSTKQLLVQRRHSNNMNLGNIQSPFIVYFTALA